MSKWIDITQKLSNDIAYWPGDTPFSYEVQFSKEKTGSVNIGKLTMGVHNGTHIDAPFHFDDDGESIESLATDIFIGLAKVIHIENCQKVNKEILANYNLDGITRLLIKTRSAVNEQEFPKSYTVLDEDLAAYLGEKGIILIGIDSPSVDGVDSKELKAHHALHANHIYILENIVLSHVEQGYYELIALPLPIKGADASPTRAVLRKVSNPHDN